jgi:hypothetical protein
MWDRPPPGEGCASDLTGFLWCLAIVILGGLAVVALAAWVVGR